MVSMLLKIKSYSLPVNWGILVIRVLTSVMMLTHGGPKFMRLLDGNLKFGDPLSIGSELSFLLVVFAEFFCSIFIIIGFATRLSSIPLLITMLVALFIAHGDDPLLDHVNIIVYIAIYILLFFTGSGKYSIDYKFFSKYQK